MIIGLSGYAGSGKDTVGRHLVDEHGFFRIAFADALRNVAYELNPIIAGGMYENDVKLVYLREVVDTMGWDEAKAYYPEVRKALQVLGVSIREYNPKFWIHIAAEKMLDVIKRGGDVVITDVRFPNEAELIETIGGEVWRIERPDVEQVNEHISESAMDDWSFKHTLKNDSDIFDLHSLINYYLSLNKRSA